MATVICTQQIEGQFPVSIIKTGRTYTVTYGAQETKKLNWSQAAREFGNCVFHAIECAGLINRTH